MTIQSLIVDSREPTWIQQLSFGTAPKMVQALSAGDLWLACSDDALLVIERKTPGDLLNTLRDDRLFPQMAALREVSQWAYLLITGELQRGPDGKCITDRLTGWDWAAVQGVLLTVQEMGVRVVHCAGDGDVEATIIRLANRERGMINVFPPSRLARVLDETEQIFVSLPGIGVERLDALVRACGPLQARAGDILQALTDDTYRPIAGLGPLTKRRIRQALGVPDGHHLEIASDVKPSLEGWEEITLILPPNCPLPTCGKVERLPDGSTHAHYTRLELETALWAAKAVVPFDQLQKEGENNRGN